MKTFIKAFFLGLLLTCFLENAQAQCSVTVTSDGRCEGAALHATTSDGILEQLAWRWKSRNDSLLFTSTINQQYGPGITVAGGNGNGSAANQINGAWGMCVDQAGNIYIADTWNDRIQKWAPGATEGVTVAGGNGRGSAPNQLALPYDVKIDEANNLYIVDIVNARIQKWQVGASEGITVAGGNGSGAALNQLNQPAGIWLDKYNAMYIADQFNHRIQKWLPGASEGITVAGGNGGGAAPNQLYYPIGVAVDTAGNVYVTGDGIYSNRVQKWAPGAVEGVTVAGGIFPGNGNNQLDYPVDVFIDHLGNLFVTDKSNDRIQKYLPGSDTAVTVASGHFGSGPYDLNRPSAAWVSGDTVYVVDQLNDRIQMYVPDGQPPEISHDFTPVNGGNITATAIFKKGCTATSDAIHVKPLPKFTGIKGKKRNLCGGGNFAYSVDALGEAESYKWTVPPGCTLVSGQGTASITVSIPASFSSGALSVMAKNSCGVGPTFSDTLTTKPAQPGDITGPARVHTDDTVTYRVKAVEGINYRWEIPVAGVVIVSGQNTPKISVAWNSGSSGTVIVKASACTGGTEASSRKSVERVSGLVASNVDALKTNTGVTNLKVYPNPAFNKATAAFSASGTYTLQIIDMAGKVLYSIKDVSTKTTNKIEIDISRFSKGNYFVVLKDNNGKKIVQLSKQ